MLPVNIGFCSPHIQVIPVVSYPHLFRLPLPRSIYTYIYIPEEPKPCIKAGSLKKKTYFACKTRFFKNADFFKFHNSSCDHVKSSDSHVHITPHTFPLFLLLIPESILHPSSVDRMIPTIAPKPVWWLASHELDGLDAIFCPRSLLIFAWRRLVG